MKKSMLICFLCQAHFTDTDSLQAHDSHVRAPEEKKSTLTNTLNDSINPTEIFNLLRFWDDIQILIYEHKDAKGPSQTKGKNPMS